MALKHGHCKNGKETREYKTWVALRQRCNNPKDKAYTNYGGRGIKVCTRWSEFKTFLKDMGKKPKGLTIERINNSLGYRPDNCKWATYQEQNNNQQIRKGLKLNPLKVQIIKKLLKESYLKRCEICEIFSVTSQTISKIKVGVIWKKIE